MCGGSGFRVLHLEWGTGVCSWPQSGPTTIWKVGTTGSTPGWIPEDLCHFTSSSKSCTRKPLPSPCRPGSWRKENWRGCTESRPPDWMESFSNCGNITTMGTLVPQSSSGSALSYMDLWTCDAVLCGSLVSGDCMLTYVVYLCIVRTHKCDVMTCFLLLVLEKCFTLIYLLI